ncbi:unnamed protein product [Prorocentrum cordatum]|uniref:BTB domain-containing protein n=1 Tax=Prorocentrum cordatum TaxID=2364126 RepID=A0ABN9V3Z2_9DINO|nr:unnamed protein product [Polarella glacialis]
MAAAAQGPPRPGEDECRAALRDIWRSRPQVSAPILLRRELERHLGLPQRSLDDVQWVAQLSQAERAAREEQRRAERGGRRRAADGGRDLRAPRPKAARRARPPACGAERGWRELWDTRRFADAAVECGGRRLEVHRAVLAARSPVLMAMFGQERACGRGSRGRWSSRTLALASSRRC